MLSSLCTLHRHEGEQIILCGDGNLVRLLPKGHSELEPDLAVEGPACGLVAMGSPAVASSTGLKWDLGVFPTSLSETAHEMHQGLRYKGRQCLAQNFAFGRKLITVETTS